MSVVDIEDVINESGEGGRLDNEKKTEKKKCGSKVSLKNKKDRQNGVTVGKPVRDRQQSFVPGNAKVYMRTWGCAHNSSDSEYMAGLLSKAGYTVSFENPKGAHIWVLNSCTVKTPSEQQLQNQIKEATSKDVPVVVAGCVSQGAPQTAWLKGLSIVGVQQIDRIVEVVEESLQGNAVRLLASKRSAGKRLGGANLSLPKIRKNNLIEILAINTGCLNQCTYCKTKQARGDLASYPIEELVERAQFSFQEGVKEVWLTSEDLGAYGRDIGCTLPDLLVALVEVIPEGCMMRLGMTNPPYILDHLQEIADVLNHPRVYTFLHIPVQSGSDAVLMDMKREYSCHQFRRVVEFMKEKVEGISIATDVICGFPTETPDDFQETMKLVEDYKFPSLFINQYFPRPNTPAARMKRINTQEVKRRTKAISELFATIFPYEGKDGSIHTVLVTEEAADNKSLVGHNKAYQQIILPYRPWYRGEMLTCRVTSTGKHYMIGQPLWKDSVLLMLKYFLSPSKTSTQLPPESRKRDNWKRIAGFSLVMTVGVALTVAVRYLNE